MTMVIVKGKGCANCGKRWTTPNPPVDVYVRFQRLKIEEDSGIEHSFVVEFCSLECFYNFDWTQLRTFRDFMKMHLGKNWDDPNYRSHYQQ